MSSRVVVAGLAVVGVAVGAGAFASAEAGERAESLPTTPPASVMTQGGGHSDSGSGSSGGGGEGGGATVNVPCLGNPYPLGFFRSETLYDGEPFSSMEDPSTFPAGTEQYWQYDCYEGCPAGYSPSVYLFNGCGAWVGLGEAAPTVTVDDLWPGAYDEAVSQIPLPIPEVAPPVIQGSLVNAPLWLAVTPPVPVSARAQVGAVWAQVDATFVGLTWHMGVPGTDDDVVECDGPGEPWEGFSPTEDPWEVPDCGWNYEQPSTPENTGNGNSWYDVTVTAHWELRLTGSDGRDEALDPIDVPIEFDYVVYELQTVGSS